MKVKIKKVHLAYAEEFKVGDIVELNNTIVTSKKGNKFFAKDLTNCFSNKCSYGDVFEKIETDV